MKSMPIDREVVAASSARIGVGDAGATNSLTGMWAKGDVSLVHSRHTAATTRFVQRLGLTLTDAFPHYVVISAAGPVENNKAVFTNRDGFVLAADEVENGLRMGGCQAPATVVNDGFAAAAGVIMLTDDEYVQANGATAPLLSHGFINVVVIGTGLGIGTITDGKKARRTEQGHIWARRGSRPDIDEELVKKFGNALVAEDYVSGLGLENIARALIATRCSGWQDAERELDMAPRHDRAKFIAQRAKLGPGNPVFTQAFAYFREQLGYLISALSTTCGAVVLAGAPAVNDFVELFGKPTETSACWRIKPFIVDRHDVVEVADSVPLYVVNRPRQPLNLSGAGAIGAMLHAQAACAVG